MVSNDPIQLQTELTESVCDHPLRKSGSAPRGCGGGEAVKI